MSCSRTDPQPPFPSAQRGTEHGSASGQMLQSGQNGSSFFSLHKNGSTSPKTASSKWTIPLPNFAIEALQKHRLQQVEQRLRAPRWEHPQLVFTNSTGSYYWYKILDEQFKSLLEAAGLPKMRFHDVRHNAATILLAIGVDAKVIQDRLGHSRISTTLDIYSHVTKSMQEDATAKIDAHFHRPAGEKK